MKTRLLALAFALALTLPTAAMAASGSGSGTLFISSAKENGDGTVTFPLRKGTSGGKTVWYIVLDANTSAAAAKYGVNRANKLANAGGAIMPVTVKNGVIDFPASVDFSFDRKVVPGPTGFPPLVAEPGARGEPGYSPLIRLPDGTVLNAPQIKNDTGQADKIVSVDVAGRKVTYKETNGFARGDAVRYVSTDSSLEVAAALEDVTYAPRLDDAPFAGGDGTDSARASLAAFVNGRLGAANPNRQGLNSAILDGLDPLNLLAWKPNQGRYSPLWDVHLAAWTSQAIDTGQNVRQKSFADVQALAEKGLVTAPDGSAFGPSGFVVNCPIVAQAQ